MSIVRTLPFVGAIAFQGRHCKVETVIEATLENRCGRRSGEADGLSVALLLDVEASLMSAIYLLTFRRIEYERTCRWIRPFGLRSHTALRITVFVICWSRRGGLVRPRSKIRYEIRLLECFVAAPVSTRDRGSAGA